jgi:hypothetical protein
MPPNKVKVKQEEGKKSGAAKPELKEETESYTYSEMGEEETAEADLPVSASPSPSPKRGSARSSKGSYHDKEDKHRGSRLARKDRHGEYAKADDGHQFSRRRRKEPACSRSPQRGRGTSDSGRAAGDETTLRLVPASSGTALGLTRQQKRAEYNEARKLRRVASKQHKQAEKAAARLARQEARKKKKAEKRRARFEGKCSKGKGKGKHKDKSIDQAGGSNVELRKGAGKASRADSRAGPAAGSVKREADRPPSRERAGWDHSSGEGGDRRRGPPSAAEARPASRTRSPSGTPPRRQRRKEIEKYDDDEEVFEKGSEYAQLAVLSGEEAGPVDATFSASSRPNTGGKFCRKRGGIWMAKSSSGWLEVPHPPPPPAHKQRRTFLFAGRPVSWSAPELWQEAGRRMVQILRHTEPEGILADGSLPIDRLCALVPAHPQARLLEAALFSYDESRRSYRFEIVLDLDSPTNPRPAMWVRATRKHSIAVVG